MNGHMTHPCADHLEQCDHCICCDQLHLCCATVPPELRAQLEAAVRQAASRDGLRDAIVAEGGTVAGVGALVRLEAVSQSAAPLSLLPSMPLSLPEAAEPTPDDDSRKEPVYVHAPRTA